MPKPPRVTVDFIARNMHEKFTDVENAIDVCQENGWIYVTDGRYYSTVEGRQVLSKAAENESTVTPASVHKHRVESLTGIREHTRKKLAVTKKSPMTNAVLPKKQGGRDMKVMIEDALDIAFRIRRLAEKKGKSIDEIIMEELG